MGLFVSVLTIAMGALYSAQSINARLQSTHVILDGLNLSFELMSREIRYGTVYYCGDDITLLSQTSFRKSCPYDEAAVNQGGTVLVFRPVDATHQNDRKGYYLDNGRLYEWNYINGIEQPARQITNDDVFVKSLRFFVQGAYTTASALAEGNRENTGGESDTVQPLITVMITGVVHPPRSSTKEVVFELQTSITPRGVDN